MSMVFECSECGEWFRNEKDVYHEDNGDCICVSCWEDFVEEMSAKHYRYIGGRDGRSSGSVQQN
jgi:DNA-directed RNA polymerase subunit RPC12/RpoP